MRTSSTRARRPTAPSHHHKSNPSAGATTSRARRNHDSYDALRRFDVQGSSRQRYVKEIHLAHALRLKGNLKEAIGVCRGWLRSSGRYSPDRQRTALQIEHGLSLILSGNRKGAERCADDSGLFTQRAKGQIGCLSLSSLGILLHLLGRDPQARAWYEYLVNTSALALAAQASIGLGLLPGEKMEDRSRCLWNGLMLIRGLLCSGSTSCELPYWAGLAETALGYIEEANLTFACADRSASSPGTATLIESLLNLQSVGCHRQMGLI